MTNDRDELLSWAMQAGPSTYKAFLFRLETNSAGGGVLFCIAVRKLADRYGTEKVEEACAWLQQNGGHPWRAALYLNLFYCRSCKICDSMQVW